MAEESTITKIVPCCKYLQEAAGCDPDKLLNEIESSYNGLANGEAYARIKKYGLNEITLHCSFARETVFARAFASTFMKTLFALSLLTSRFSGQAGEYPIISAVLLVLMGIYAVLKLTCRHYEVSMLTRLRQWLQSSSTVTRRYRRIGTYLDELDEENRPVRTQRIAQKAMAAAALFVPFSPLLSYIGLASLSLSGLIAVLYGSIRVQVVRLGPIRMLHTAVILGTRLLQRGIE